MKLSFNVLNSSFQAQRSPTSMSRVTIVLMLKLAKDPTDPNSHRPISLLQSDIKILGKVLAIKLNKVITSIIHPHQAGFMPKKSTAINLKRLFANMQMPLDNPWQSALLSLSTTKAFESIECQYIWAVLAKFRFGDNFISWVWLLCIWPQAVISVAGSISLTFELGRGSRQGCPLPTLLFVTAPGHSVLVQSRYHWILIWWTTRKILPYADDMLLLLGDIASSL